MDLHYHQRQVLNSHEEGTSSNEWSDGEFDDGSGDDDDDDIYDSPEADESRDAERDSHGDGSEEDGEIYDTPEDARAMLEIQDAPSVQGNRNEQPPPIISRKDRPMMASVKGDGNRYRGNDSRPLINQNTQSFDMPDGGHQVSPLELYDKPVSPAKPLRPSLESSPKPSLKPKPKPGIMPNQQMSMSNVQRPSSSIEGKRNTVAGRWPPSRQDDGPGEQSKTVEEKTNSPHQNIIDKLSKVININTPNVRNEAATERKASQPQISRDGMQSNPVPFKPRENGFTPNDRQQAPQHVPTRSPARPFRQDKTEGRPVPQPPTQVDRDNAFLNRSGGHDSNASFRQGLSSGGIVNMSNSMSDSKMKPMPPPCEQETYEVPSASTSRPEPRAALRGGPAQEVMPERPVPARPVKDFSRPDRFAQTSSIRQHPSEEPQLSANSEDQESYEVPQKEPGRPPGRPGTLDSINGRPVPSRPPKDFPHPVRHEGQSWMNQKNKLPGSENGVDVGGRRMPPQNQPENYEVPTSSVALQGQEDYEVPSQQPGRPPDRPSTSMNTGRAPHFSSMPREPPSQKQYNASYQQYNAPPERASQPANEPENYEVPTSSNLLQNQENYEVVQQEPEKSPRHAPKREGMIPPRPPKDAPFSNRPLPVRGQIEGGNLCQSGRGDFSRPSEPQNRSDPGSRQIAVPAEPETYEVLSAMQEEYEVPQQEASRQPGNLPNQNRTSTNNSSWSQRRWASEAPPSPPPGRPVMNPQGFTDSSPASNVVMEKNYEEMDSAPAIPPMRGRPKSLMMENRASQSASISPMTKPNQNFAEVVPETYAAIDEETPAVKPRTTTPGHPPFGAVMMEMNRKNSMKDRPLPSTGGRCPPEGQENGRATKYPMDQMLANVISGLENPSASTSAPCVPRRTEKEQKTLSINSRPGSLKINQSKSGSAGRGTPDAPMLNISDLHNAFDAKQEKPAAIPTRGTVPLPEVPSPKTAEQMLSEKPWFKGNMERETAENLLKKMRKNGAFVVRNTTKIVGYSISIYYEGGIRHLHIPKKNNKFHLGTSDQKFDSVIELVKFFINNKIELKAGGSTTLLDIVP